MIIAYARVSSRDQSLDIQLQQLKDAGAEKIFCEKVSGKSLEGRVELANCIAFAREGDVIIVTRMDRFGRSVKDFLDNMQTLERKGVGFKCLLQPIDTTTPEGKLFATMIAAFAEFELNVRKERQAEGIAAAKERGAYYSPERADLDNKIWRHLLAHPDWTKQKVAEHFKVSRRKVYNLISERNARAQESERVRVSDTFHMPA